MEIECGKQLDGQTVRLAGSQIQAQDKHVTTGLAGQEGR